MRAPTTPETYELYGVRWPSTAHRADVIIRFIRGNGLVTAGGVEYRVPLFTLYRDLQSVLWPDDDHHEWSDLLLKTVLEERFIAVCGPRDSGKTRGMAKYALCDYFAFPNETLILMSSTDLRGLELRVWGDLKYLWSEARDHWPTAPGNPLDSMYGIFTDALKEDTDIRDIRKGIICIPCLESGQKWTSGLTKFVGIKQKRRRLIGDECFPAGTLVDMHFGQVPIEYVRPGNIVQTFAGPRRVLATSCRLANKLCRIRLSDGRELCCTPNHSLMTSVGWVKAVDIKRGHYMLSTYEALSILQANVPTTGEASHLRCVCQKAGDLRVLPDSVYQGAPREITAVLQHELQRKMDFGAAQVSGTAVHESAQSSYKRVHEGVASGTPGTCGLPVDTNASAQSAGGEETCNGSSCCCGAAQQLGDAAAGGSGVASDIGGLRPAVERLVSDGDADAAVSLYRRRVSAPHSTDCGSRRGDSQRSEGEGTRCAKGRFSGGAWVDSVTVYQPGDSKASACGSGDVAVYNLHVEGCHAYSVSGFVVANCQLMQDPYLNVVANLNKGDFKFVGMGNPLGDGDPLDKLAEPMNGWDDLEELTVTTTWRNKWGGLTINYVGVDSPAIKHPGQFDYLITQKDIDTITQQFGKESAVWWNQAMGVRRKGVSLRKVITREMCRLFGAQDPVFWGGGEQVKVYAVDAGYGGDRCVGGEVTFGKDVNGRLVLSVGQPRIIPVRLYPNSVPESERKLPEDQIAEYVKADCERLDIPAANVYHDATGRGSLGSALARLWRHDTNPVEFGGKPSQGPVKSDLLIYDEKLRSKRLKRCDEQYTKRVSELWFAMRYVIESRQMRDLPTEVMEEMCVREWDWVKGAKQDVESKEDTKERLGRSPDMADWLAIAIWGACQRGFVIAAMSAQAPKTEQDDRWKRDLERRAARTRASYALTGA